LKNELAGFLSGIRPDEEGKDALAGLEGFEI